MKVRMLIIGAMVALVAACSGTSTEFQKDADVVRLKHLEYYGSLIESYRDKTGRYPFEGKYKSPVYVYVAHEKQIKYTKPGPPYPHEVVSFKEFVRELELVHGGDMDEFYDPQFRPDSKPNFYVYMISGSTYYFAVHVHQGFPFSRKVADNYFKIEISNKANSKNMALDPGGLFSSAAFRNEKSKKVTKIGFFEEREAKFLRHTKSG